MKEKVPLYFDRLPKNVSDNLKSLDDLVKLFPEIKDVDKFKLRFEYFKDFLKTELPELTEEEILKFDKYFYDFQKIYEWYNIENLLTALEYELRNKN